VWIPARSSSPRPPSASTTARAQRMSVPGGHSPVLRIRCLLVVASSVLTPSPSNGRDLCRWSFRPTPGGGAHRVAAFTQQQQSRGPGNAALKTSALGQRPVIQPHQRSGARTDTNAGLSRAAGRHLLVAKLGHRGGVDRAAVWRNQRVGLLCRGCGNSRGACWRPDPWRLASTPAVTRVADRSPGPTPGRCSGRMAVAFGAGRRRRSQTAKLNRRSVARDTQAFRRRRRRRRGPPPSCRTDR
jgi:hypothetical protein